MTDDVLHVATQAVHRWVVMELEHGEEVSSYGSLPDALRSFDGWEAIWYAVVGVDDEDQPVSSLHGPALLHAIGSLKP